MAVEIGQFLYLLAITLLFPAFTLLLCGLVILQNLHKKYDRIPGPKRGSFFWGNSSEFQREISKGKKKEEILRELSKKHGPIFVTWEMHKPYVMITDPELVKHALTPSNLPRDAKIYNNLSTIFGERFLGCGFATETKHDAWVRKKLVVERGFSKNCLGDLIGNIEFCCEGLIEKLTEMTEGKTDVNMMEQLRRFALDTVGKVAFGIDMKSLYDQNTPFCNALAECRLATKWARDHPYYQWDVTSFEYQNNIKEAVKYMRDYGKKMIDKRRDCMDDGEEVPDDVLNSMLKAAEQNEEITLDDLLDDFVSVFFIGQEQITSVLHSVLAELSQHPDVTRKITDEVQGMHSSKLPELEKLDCCNQALKEILRLHPPVFSVSYINAREERVGGYSIPEGTQMQILPYILHRNPEIWESPDEFIPDRFKEGNIDLFGMHYMPFGPSMKDCIGMDFVNATVKLALSHLLPKFNLVYKPDSVDNPRSKSPVVFTLTLK